MAAASGTVSDPSAFIASMKAAEFAQCTQPNLFLGSHGSLHLVCDVIDDGHGSLKI